VAAGGSCSDVGLQCPALETLPSCNGQDTTTVECTCASGAWQCPVFAGGAPSCPAPPVCPNPASIAQGGSCYADPTLSCQSNIPITDCNGNPQGFVSCSCQSGSWQCEQFGGPACEIDASAPCPDPNTVFAGQGCASYGTVCGGDPQACGSTVVYDALQCVAGVWNVVASTACDVDGGVDAETTDGGKGI
jgi:hypothetical protein